MYGMFINPTKGIENFDSKMTVEEMTVLTAFSGKSVFEVLDLMGFTQPLVLPKFNNKFNDVRCCINHSLCYYVENINCCDNKGSVSDFKRVGLVTLYQYAQEMPKTHFGSLELGNKLSDLGVTTTFQLYHFIKNIFPKIHQEYTKRIYKEKVEDVAVHSTHSTFNSINFSSAENYLNLIAACEQIKHFKSDKDKRADIAERLKLLRGSVELELIDDDNSKIIFEHKDTYPLGFETVKIIDLVEMCKKYQDIKPIKTQSFGEWMRRDFSRSETSMLNKERFPITTKMLKEILIYNNVATGKYQLYEDINLLSLYECSKDNVRTSDKPLATINLNHDNWLGALQKFTGTLIGFPVLYANDFKDSKLYNTYIEYINNVVDVKK